jgi:hypothetical protein
MSQLAKVLRASRHNMAMLGCTRALPEQRGFESTRITTQSRYEDEPEPTEDEMISKYFLT